MHAHDENGFPQKLFFPCHIERASSVEQAGSVR